MPEVLLLLFLALAVVAVVGHGLWVAVAALFGGRQASIPPAKFSENCPRCGLPLAGQRCGACHWPAPMTGEAQHPTVVLGALEKHIERIRAAGLVEPAIAARLLKAVAAEQTLIAERSAATRAPATPIPDEAVVAEIVDVPRPPESVGAEVPSHAREREFTDHLPVSQRADHFRERRAQEQALAGIPSPLVATASRAAPPARASWGDWLAAFMEERNIRWGELVGGLLIVCCSIALVISFWSDIAERPLLKFLLFNGITAGIFGVGFYSEHRWRLHTTSQGLLMIGSLLVPLNFLAIAAFTSGSAANHPLTLVGELVSTVLFSALLFFAGRVLVPNGAAVLAAGVIVPSLAQLLVRRFAEPGAGLTTIWALAALPIGCYAAVGGWSSWRFSARGQANEEDVNGLLKFLGMASFAALVPLGLLLAKSEQPLAVLRELSVGVSLWGAVPLFAGLVVWQKLNSGELPALRTAGTSVAVFGALVSLAGLVVGWPDPVAMLPVALFEFVVFTCLAWRLGLPAAHLLAAVCLALGYLLSIYVFEGRLEWRGQPPRALADTIISGNSGALLPPLVIAYAATAFVIRRRATVAFRWLTTSGGVLAIAAAALTTVSLALVSWFGFGRAGDPHGAAWVYLLYAVGALVVAARQPRAVFAWVGAALLLAAVIQGFMFRYPLPGTQFAAALVCVLLYGSLCVAIAWLTRVPKLTLGGSRLGEVLASAAFLASVAAAVWLVWLAPTAMAAFEATRWLWLAGVWLALGVYSGQRATFMLTQFGLVSATVFGVGALLEQHAWFVASRWPWLDPWTLQAVGVALAGLTLGWTVLRIVVDRRAVLASSQSVVARSQQILSSPWVSVDRWTAGCLIALLFVIGAYSAWPGVCQELAPRDIVSVGAGTQAVSSLRVVPDVESFALRHIPHAHATQGASWLLLAVVLLATCALAYERRSTAWLLALLPVTFVACPLVASRFEADVAVASALRWTSAVWLVLASTPIWARTFLSKRFVLGGWKPERAVGALQSQATWLVLVLGLAAPLAMMTLTGLAALARSRQFDRLLGDWTVLWLVCGIALAASAGLSALARQKSAAEPQLTALWRPVSAAVALVLAVAPVLAVLLYEIGLAMARSPIVGPEPSSAYGRMGLAVSYGMPLILVAGTLVGYALSNRSAAFALAGGLMLNAAATAGFLLAPRTGGLVFDAAVWIRLAQLYAVVAAAYGACWLSLVRFGQRRRGDQVPIDIGAPLGTQIALAPALLVLAYGWAWCDLFINPQGHPAQTRVMNAELADAWGLLCIAAVAAAGAWLIAAARRRTSIALLGASLSVVVVLAAAVAGRWDQGNWLAYNTLGVGHALLGSILLAVAWHDRRAGERGTTAWFAGSSNTLWVDLARGAVLVLALREFADNRWWSAGGFAVLAVTGAASAWIYQRRRYLYDAALFVNAAGSVAWLQAQVVPGPLDFAFANIVFLAAPAPLWLIIEMVGIRSASANLRIAAPPAHRLVTRLSIAALGVLAGIGLFLDAQQLPPFDGAPWMPWIALSATALAAIACLWEGPARDAIARLYVLGLVAAAMIVNLFDLPPPWLLWTGTIVLAAYALATSYLWSRRRGLRTIADRLRIPRPADDELAGLAWLVPCNLILIAVVVGLTGLIELSETTVALRVLAAQAVLTQVVSVALIARGDHRGVLQSTALALGAIGAVMFGWSWLQPGTTGTLLNALVVMAAALAGVAAFYGLGLGKLLWDASDWLTPARRMTPVLAALTLLSLAAILTTEIYQFARLGEVAMAWPAILVVGLTLGGLTAAALSAAVLPGRDPLNLSPRGRTLYVYGAEVLLALLFVHVRLTLPWLFAGFFQQYWPLVTMAIAFTGVGFAELCRRYRQEVLAGPLENTGALLPVLPVLGFWASDTRVDYSLLLLVVGVLYAGLSIARKSFGFGVLAALAANGGLWFFLNRQEGFGFLAHPQIWLIPPAVCILLAAYLNRAQLSDEQLTAVRYLTSTTIYVSSTADIFLNGVAQQPWLPVVLAGLSLLGIAAGIVLRVRAFLLLGTSFLGLALFTIIWHAAVDLDQTWIWYASGIIMGVAILALFAVFEKKRREILDLFDQIKQWNA